MPSREQPNLLQIDTAVFRPEAVADETRALNADIIAKLTNAPNWWEIGAEAAREGRRQGRGPFPLQPASPRAVTRTIASGGRNVPVRIVAPDHPKGVMLWLHGGGWTLGAADQQDADLERMAQAGIACVSVEYRLAPEHPYPAGPDDCETAALWLVENAQREFGTGVLFIGGESAGAHLAAVTLLRLRDRHGIAGFAGANLVFGCFDMAMTPSQRHFGNERLVLRNLDLVKFGEAFVGHVSDRRDPDVSPLYADLGGMPPALFTVGTRDPLLDDTLFMAMRWSAAGNAAELQILPGAPHAFTLFDCAVARQAQARMAQFLAMRCATGVTT